MKKKLSKTSKKGYENMFTDMLNGYIGLKNNTSFIIKLHWL